MGTNQYDWIRKSVSDRYNNGAHGIGKYLLQNVDTAANIDYVIKGYIDRVKTINEIVYTHYMPYNTMRLEDYLSGNCNNFSRGFEVFMNNMIRSHRNKDLGSVVDLHEKLFKLIIRKKPIHSQKYEFDITPRMNLDKDYIFKGSDEINQKAEEFVKEVFVFNTALEMFDIYKESSKEECAFRRGEFHDGVYRQLSAMIKQVDLPSLFVSAFNGEVVDKLLEFKKSTTKVFTEAWDEQAYVKDTQKKLCYLYYPLLIPFKLIRLNNNIKKKLLDEILEPSLQQELKYITRKELETIILEIDGLLISKVREHDLVELLNPIGEPKLY